MKINVLGCYGGEMPGYATSSFLINNKVAVDAGAVTSHLSLAQQPKISAILVSHTHLDHILEIGFLADNIFGKRDEPVEIYGIKESIEYMKKHFMNDRIWPDFTKIPTKENPVLSYRQVEPGKTFEVEGLECMAIPVEHTIPAVGYLISDKKSSMVYSGDTGPTKELWKKAAELKNLKAVFIEASFPNNMEELAKQTGHLTPKMMGKEIDKIKLNNFKAYTFHMKPQYLKNLEEEIRNLAGPIKVAKQGDEIKT